MIRRDLKSGMLVQLRNGGICMVINGYIVDRNSEFHISLVSYNECMEHADKTLDIVKVSEVLTGTNLCPYYWGNKALTHFIKWERDITQYVKMSGRVYKVVEETAFKTTLELGTLTERWNSSLNDLLERRIVTPSTKEEYEAQFKTNKFTVKQIEDMIGLRNIQIVSESNQ